MAIGRASCLWTDHIGSYLGFSEVDAEGMYEIEGSVFYIKARTTVERVMTVELETNGIECESLAFERGGELRAAFYAGRF